MRLSILSEVISWQHRGPNRQCYSSPCDSQEQQRQILKFFIFAYWELWVHLSKSLIKTFFPKEKWPWWSMEQVSILHVLCPVSFQKALKLQGRGQSGHDFHRNCRMFFIACTTWPDPSYMWTTNHVMWCSNAAWPRLTPTAQGARTLTYEI